MSNIADPKTGKVPGLLDVRTLADLLLARAEHSPDPAPLIAAARSLLRLADEAAAGGDVRRAGS